MATILGELAASLEGHQLVEEAGKVPLAWAQRLGYLLEYVKAGEAIRPLAEWIRERANRVVPLDAALPRTGARRSKQWRVAINAEIEMDQ